MKKNLTFIAEIGMNHNGNFGLFFELIKQAADADADFAKFQLGWRDGKGEINQLSDKEIILINKCCEYHNIKPLFSIITPKAFKLIDKYELDAYKIASRTVIEHPDMVKKILKKNKPTFISLGMTDESEPFGRNENIHYLWCKSEYPAYPWDLNGFPKEFSSETTSGYSDHTVGIEISLLAISRGAEIIEKHFSLDKSDVTIRDHALSATPEEFRQLVLVGRKIRQNLNLGI